MATFGEQLRDALERRHMDQKQLADLLDVSTRAVNDWVNDRAMPRNRMGALKAWAPELGGEQDGLVPLDEVERQLWALRDDLPPGEAEKLILMRRGEHGGARRSA